MKNFALFSLVFLLFIAGCAPALKQVEPTLTPSPTITNTPTITPSPTRTPLPTISPLVEQLKPGQVVMHPATENNLYVFYSYFPRSAVREKDIFVGVWPHGGAMPNNDYEAHKEQAKNTLSWLSSYAEKYKTPLVVVAIPRVEELYVHTMPVGTFTTSNEFLKRPDLKLIEAIWNQYIPSLQQAGFNVQNKVFMMGFSSPGTFTFRFSILHPELISAAWLGSSSFAPLPTAEIFGQPADYPFGIRNLEQLSGSPFNLDDYKKISFLIVTGENDNKENNVTISWYSNKEFIKKNMGETEPERIKFFYDYLVSIGVPAEFHLYPKIAHEITEEMMKDAFDFLVTHSQP
jgi:predicted esterase